MKKNIIIAGGGFAGLASLDYLAHHRIKLLAEYDIILADKKRTFDFLPLAPDVLAGWLNPQCAQIDLKAYAEKRGFRFIRGLIKGIYPERNIIEVGDNQISYAYILIATGAETNFFGHENARKNCLALNSLGDALSIKAKLLFQAKSRKLKAVVVAGGGYTGIEALFGSHFLLKRQKIDCRFILVEKTPKILGVVPQAVRKEVEEELNRRHIAVLTDEIIEEYREDTVFLKSGKIIDNAVCIWSAGVRSPLFLDGLGAQKLENRIKVNPDLTIANSPCKNIFLAGDSAAFSDKKSEKSLRMAVMFAIGQAKIAAANILRSLDARPLKSYWPLDLGYFIPLMYGKAPGVVFGRRVSSRLGYLLHYALCLYRSKPYKVPAILKDILTSRI